MGVISMFSCVIIGLVFSPRGLGAPSRDLSSILWQDLVYSRCSVIACGMEKGEVGRRALLVVLLLLVVVVVGGR